MRWSTRVPTTLVATRFLPSSTGEEWRYSFYTGKIRSHNQIHTGPYPEADLQYVPVASAEV